MNFPFSKHENGVYGIFVVESVELHILTSNAKKK
jgi:hypothetical protein